MLKFSEEEREVTWEEIDEMINNLKPGKAICVSFEPKESEDDE